MPFREPRKYLYDIINCCEFLLDFTKSKTVDDYKKDRAFRSAVERELQIIGEAMMQLDRTNPETAEQISEHRHIIGFRNVLVHGYASLNPDTVWDVVENKLQELLSQSQNCLKKL
jgi:uncharacterized protein with HEPN domain